MTAIRIVEPAALDAKLAEIAGSPKGPAAHFHEFWFDMPIDPALDPLSAAYRDIVLAHYQRVAGSGGSPTSAIVQPDIDPDDPLVIRPWPYNTGSGTQVGDYLQAIGFVIATCQPRSGHRVLQMGISNVDLALPLASMGCAVTVVDPDARNVALLRWRAERSHISLAVKQIELSKATDVLPARHYDFVVFQGTFHRHLDHLQLLRLVQQHLLAPGGRLVLAGEPLLEAFPAPWGLQNAGASIWSMRHGGGLSLVFRPSYLIEALVACGYSARLEICSQTALGNVLIAQRT